MPYGVTLTKLANSNGFAGQNVASKSEGAYAFADGSYSGCSDRSGGIARSSQHTGTTCYKNLNDGLFGNGNGWQGYGATTAYAGISFKSITTIEGFSLGRDQTGSLLDKISSAKKVEVGECPFPIVLPSFISPSSLFTHNY